MRYSDGVQSITPQSLIGGGKGRVDDMAFKIRCITMGS